MAEKVFKEEEDRDFIAIQLKANESERCTLEGVPFEFSNINIKAQLEQYLEGVKLENEEHKDVPEGMGPIYTGSRIVRYTKMKKEPPTRIGFGRGIFGWLNSAKKDDMATYVVECTRCREKGHLANECEREAKCTKCAETGHQKWQCVEEDCRHCWSKHHISVLCPKESSARARIWTTRGPSYANVTARENGDNENWSLKEKPESEEDEEEIDVISQISNFSQITLKDPEEQELEMLSEEEGDEEEEEALEEGVPREVAEKEMKKTRSDGKEKKEMETDREIRDTGEELENAKKPVETSKKEEKQGEDTEGNIGRAEGMQDEMGKVVEDLEADQAKKKKKQLEKQIGEGGEGSTENLRIKLGRVGSEGGGSQWLIESGEAEKDRVKKTATRGKGVEEKKEGAKKKSPIQKLGEKIKGRMSGIGEAQSQGKAGQRRKVRSGDEKISEKTPKKQRVQNGEKSVGGEEI